MENRRIVIRGIITLACLIFGFILLEHMLAQLPTQPTKELKLSDFPEVFKDSTLIVVGDGASERELQAAEDIADYLKNKTGSKPLIKKHSEITEKDKRNYNLIVVGTPESNKMLGEIYKISDVLEVNESFPGEGKGILEILPNPWNESKAMLLVEGQEYKNPASQYVLGRGIDTMKQILLQENKIRKIKVSKIYGPYNGWKPHSQPGIIGFPNPAALYCEKVGYWGSDKCNTWEFFSGLCDEEHTYCSRTGGILVTIKNWCRFAPVCAVCILPSGKICYEFDYAMGVCK